MKQWLNPYSATVALGLLVQLAFTVRWLYRRTRNDELTRAFVRDMAVNHLPHVYHCLRELCRRQGIVIDDPPVIRWVDLNWKRGP
jgi:hypothetical protein